MTKRRTFPFDAPEDVRHAFSGSRSQRTQTTAIDLNTFIPLAKLDACSALPWEASPPWSTAIPPSHKEFAFLLCFQFVFKLSSAPRRHSTFILNRTQCFQRNESTKKISSRAPSASAISVRAAASLLLHQDQRQHREGRGRKHPPRTKRCRRSW